MYPDRDIIPQALPAPDVLLRLLAEKSKYITKNLMSGPLGNSVVRFVFPRVLINVSFDFISGNINTLGKTKLIVSLGTIH